MTIKQKFTIVCLTLVCCLFHFQCSTTQIAGTETGNPGISAVAKSIFTNSSLTSKWHPLHFLAGGINQLDPDYIASGSSVKYLAKRTSSDTSSYSIKIILYQDTVIKIDTVYVKDTLYMVNQGYDTIFHVINKDSTSDTIIVRKEKETIDSIFVNDMVIVKDTSYITRADTIYYKLNMDAINLSRVSAPASTIPGNNYNISPNFDSSGNLIYVYDTPSGKGGQTEGNLPTPNYTTSSATNILSADRQATIDGYSIFERYSDADGDGTLYKARGDLISVCNFEGSYRKGTSVKTIAMIFDAGMDNQFGLSIDNRIKSLSFIKADSLGTEKVSFYANLYATMDFQKLVKAMKLGNSQGDSSYTQYNLKHTNVNGAISSLRMYSFFHSTFGISSDVTRTEVVVSFDSLVDYTTQKLPNASIRATAYYGKGRIGEIEGNIDFNLKRISGTYTENGESFTFRYDYLSDTFEQAKPE